MKKSTPFITIYAVTILFMSCHKPAKYENASGFSFEDFKTVTTLNADVIEFDEPIMRPLLFVLSDSLLIMQNIRTEYVLHVYNVRSKKKVGEYISFGSGPNELLRVKNMQLIDSDLYISDNQLNVVYKYDVNDFHKLISPVPKHKVQIKEMFTSLAYTDDRYVATTLDTNNKRLVFFNPTGEKEFTAGDYPCYGKELSDIEKMESFTSSILVSRKYQRIYLFGMDTDLIEIYDFNGNFIRRIHGPEQFFPQIKEIHTGNDYSHIATTDDSRFAFFNPIYIDDEIYVSYSGKHQNRDEEIASINYILVFDKDCNPVRRYELSASIVAFAVDPETKHIYATGNIPDFHMIVFKP
jgi:hypothetical protein